jgi:hypoxanthine-DNA glycosylase
MSCQRQGSLDSNIIEEIPNDLKSFLKQYPQIEHLFFNGKKAQEYFFRYMNNIQIPYTVLPSTSPAHAVSFERKLEEWKIIKEFIDNLK